MMLPFVANAQMIVIDGIYYFLTAATKQAKVTLSPDGYHGSVLIPEKITYESVEYSVTSIGLAFKGCPGLTSVTIPNSMTIIEEFAFSGCSGLTSVTIPNSVTSIEWGAFVYCSGLTSITIPNSVSAIGNEAFAHCSGLTSVNIGNSVWFIGNEAFAHCSGLTSITIPNSVTIIGESAFSGCSGLTSITIPNSVTSIGGSAFRDVDLQIVVSLIENPFPIKGKSTLGFSPTFSEYTFNKATLYVPVGTKEKYQATGGWNQFANIVEGTPTGIKAIENSNKKSTSFFDLNGVSQPEPRKGINIIKGKKIVVK